MLNPNEFVKLVKSYERRFQEDIRTKIIPEAGRLAKEHFDRSFKEEGFTDKAFEKWPGRVDGSRPQDPILVETGRLSVSNKIRKIAGGVQIYNSTPYGRYHNHGIGQRQRRFIGVSGQLNMRIKGVIKAVALETFSRI